MKNILISDSEPLSNKDLILAQKIDSFIDNKDNPLPIFRESIKPGVEVKFTMKIQDDASINIESIKNRIYNFYKEIDYNLLKHFDVEERDGEFIYIGGGSGFTSKTNIYQLLDEDMGLKVVSNILDDKFQRKGHLNDINLGVAPRTLKNTIFEGNKYEMGLCKIEFKEIDRL
ncbi:MAG: hypothetical protein Q4P34_08875 [Tissierellia bacterium]|nr:hypothetical protein [Tissierellia bacterium]